MNSIEREVLLINRVDCPPHHPGLHLVVLLWQQLQLDVGVSGLLNLNLLLIYLALP